MNKHQRIRDVDPESSAPTRGQIYVGLGWTTDLIIAARAKMQDDLDALNKACDELAEANREHKMVDLKMASHAVQKAAEALGTTAPHHIKYISEQSSMLHRKATEHLNRRGRRI